jgi:hypothetical protein
MCIVVVMLAGVTNNGLFLFSTDTKNLSISVADLSSLHRRADHMALSGSAITNAIASGGNIKTTNITAADIGLYDSYTVSLWNYCYTTGGTKTCMPAKFDWASDSINIINNLTSLAAQNGANFTAPTLVNAVKTFSQVVKWTEIVYIIAGVLAALELVVGLFAFCSRVGSCCTFIVSGFFTTAIIAAAGMSTTLAVIVVGAVSALKQYGVSAAFNTSFLAISWLAAAFAVAAGLFWLFSICCCKGGSSKRHSKAGHGEKVGHGGYQRVNDPFLPQHGHGHQETGYIPPSHHVPAQKYEPYSHGAV